MATTINFPLTTICGQHLSIGNILALLLLERHHLNDFVPFSESGINKDTINYLTSRMCRGVHIEGFDEQIVYIKRSGEDDVYAERFNKALDYLLDNIDDVMTTEPYEYDPIHLGNFLMCDVERDQGKINLSRLISSSRDRDDVRKYYYTEDFDTLHEDGSLRFCNDCEDTYVYDDCVSLSEVCRDCFRNHYWYCDDCDDYFHEDDVCRCCSDDDESEDFYRATINIPSIGNTTKQFTQRTIGIEFETQENANQLSFIQALKNKLTRWGIHEDGSLPSDALEFVTNPLSGHIIQNEVIDFYDLCDKYGVQIQGKSAGMHIHTDAHELFDIIGKHQEMAWVIGTAKEYTTRLNIKGSLISKKNSEYGETYYSRVDNDFADEIEYADVPEEVMIMFGNAFVNLTRCFIGKNRALNTYCTNPFAFRNKGSKPKELKKTNSVSYPAIAVRSMKTFEFRLFPSTGSRNYALARIELSQKLVDHMVKLMTEQKSWDRISPDVMPDMYKFFELCASVNHQDSVLPTNIVQKLGDMIGLSDECQSSLQNIYTRYHLNDASETFSI